MKTKTTMNYYFPPTRMATIIKNQNKTEKKSWRRCQETGALRHCSQECETVFLSGKQFGNTSKTETVTLWPSDSTTGYISKRREDTPHKNLDTKVQSCIIHNSPKEKQPNIFQQMNGSNVTAHLLLTKYPHSEILLSRKMKH